MKRTRSRSPQKSRSIGVRLNTEEFAALEAFKADFDIPTNNLAIRVLIRAAGGLVEPEPEIVAAWRSSGLALALAGSNINQIAKAANSGGVIWDKADDAALLEVRDECRKLAGLLAKFISASKRQRASKPVIARAIATFGE